MVKLPDGTRLKGKASRHYKKLFNPRVKTAVRKSSGCTKIKILRPGKEWEIGEVFTVVGTSSSCLKCIDQGVNHYALRKDDRGKAWEWLATEGCDDPA